MINESLKYCSLKKDWKLISALLWDLCFQIDLSIQESGVSGLNSKTHMKLMLKWMRGRKMLKLFCNQIGSSKKFLLSTLPEDPQTEQSKSPSDLKLQTEKPSRKLGEKKKR